MVRTQVDNKSPIYMVQILGDGAMAKEIDS